MKNLLKWQQQLVPDLLAQMKVRYSILQSIRLNEPVGRRLLAQMLDMTERVLRSEVDFLKSHQLIEYQTAGMGLTNSGRELLLGLEDYMRETSGLYETEEQLGGVLGISKTIIVSGDSDKIPLIKDEIGKACASILEGLLEKKNIITVTGGTTMNSVAEALEHIDVSGKEILFIPARGGVGGKVIHQANSIAETMAENTGSGNRALYMPDVVSDELRSILLKEPSINATLDIICSADIVLHGIGEALKMAERRNTVEKDMDTLIKGKAVGEAFGYYFDDEGSIVHKVSTIGLQLEDLPAIKHIIAVAGGKSKAKAIRAYMKNAPPTSILITDEGAAIEILKGE
ncbi:transcriptional regulator [Siminovitchia terrae]|uniref:Transcriptional regulator n=1 Tax=Siminovitchia terrae TaxID=1914933 RepID=A0ABQ4L376_SIMTE|nr:sugar-binding domain-containing protein [Siminovitchia terrae]GIN98340.1 transcriptional regulator [Siminovitchia terrae]